MRNAEFVYQHATFAEVVHKLIALKIHRLYVVQRETGQLIGIITHYDIMDLVIKYYYRNNKVNHSKTTSENPPPQQPDEKI